jgi:xanthine dehydrogenase accessory protein XdhC
LTRLAPLLGQALASGEKAILVTVARAEGSTPREAGATMLVTRDAAHGTIGGGQLEFHAIDVAREMIVAEARERRLDVPLGPHLGQCCGGRVELLLRAADEAIAASLGEIETEAARARPHVLLLGAGHVGLALARSLTLLPLAVTLVDDRDTPPPPLPAGIVFERVDDPETLVTKAPAGSAFVILTHSHSLDYRLADTALARTDAAYVGMIGSATKRARFERWFLARGGASEALGRFSCPIGGKAVRDKRPEVIAALATAEIVAHVFTAGKASAHSRKVKAATTSISGAKIAGAKIGRHIRAA